MLSLINTIHKIEKSFADYTLRFSAHHPYICLFAAFIVASLFVLGSVCVCTIIIVLPISFIMGWI